MSAFRPRHRRHQLSISLLPLAFTFLPKAIKRVLNLAVTFASRQAVTWSITSNRSVVPPDHRSLINSLQILCQQGGGAGSG